METRIFKVLAIATLLFIFSKETSVAFAAEMADDPVEQFFLDTEIKATNHTILKTSDKDNLQKLELLESKNILLICDIDFEYQDQFICGRGKVEFKDKKPKNLSLEYLEERTIFLAANDTNKFLIIPADNFSSEDRKSETIAQIRALRKTLENESKVEQLNTTSTGFDLQLNEIRRFLYDKGFALLGYTVIILGALLTFSKSEIQATPQNKRKKKLIYSLVLIYFFALASISLKDLGKLDLTYITEFVIFTTDPRNISRIIVSPIRIGFLLMLVLTNLVVFIQYRESLRIKATNIRKAQKEIRILEKRAIKLTAFLSTVLIIICSNTSFREYSLTFVAILLLLLFSIYRIQWEKITNDTKKLKVYTTILVTLATIYTLFLNSKYATFTKRDLIGVPEQIVYLPYIKAHTGDSFFRQTYIKDEASIVVNKYLINHPQYNIVINKPISEFEDTGSYIVQAKQNAAYELPTIEKQNLENTESITHYFYDETLPEVEFTKVANDLTVEISEPINNLQRQGILREPFLISSYEKINPIIKFKL